MIWAVHPKFLFGVNLGNPFGVMLLRLKIFSRINDSSKTKKMMLKKSVFMLLLVCSLNLSGQEVPSKRYIAVTGSAEVNVPPDEIKLAVTISEYDKGLKGNKKQPLTKVEAKFFKILEANHISKEQVTLQNAGDYWYYWWKSRRDQYRQKSFILTLDNSTDFLSLVRDLDFKGVRSLDIHSTTNKELQRLRREVKINAVKAAKEKATYLLESIGEKLGKVISIREVPANNYYWRSQNMMSNVVISEAKPQDKIDNVTVIKLRYEIQAQFEIQ